MSLGVSLGVPRLLLALPLLLLLSFDAHRAVVPVELDEPDAASRFESLQRGVPRGVNPHRLYDAARLRMAKMSHTTGTWTFLGPGNIGGRTRPLLIDPHDTNVLYAGAVSGGVWKTTNGGNDWMPVGDQLANIAVNSLAFDPLDSRTIYAGTGEGYYREDVRGTALPIQGDGIFVTHDAGSTWSRLESTTGDDFAFVNDLAVSAHDSARLYAATRTGVWSSHDRGATWSRALATSVKGGCLDLALRGDAAGDYLFASCGTFERATVYRNKNAESDSAWESVLSEPNMGRTSLAISPSNPSIVYALAANNTPGIWDQGLLAVFRSDHDGDAGSWTARVRNDSSDPLSRLLLTNVLGATASECFGQGASNVNTNMGWHSNVIAVDPVDPEKVWAAGVDLYRSNDGGATWRLASYWWGNPASTTAFVHADQHLIVFDPHYDGASNQTLYATNDGGVYRTHNARAPIAQKAGNGACDNEASLVQWDSLNHNFGATQFYHGTAMTNGRYAGGAQDNGTLVGSDEDGIDGWKMVYGGDGGNVAFDAESDLLYGEYQWASIARIDPTNHYKLTAIYPGLTGKFLFITPYVLDPNDSSRLWLGGENVFSSPDRGSTWGIVSGKTDGTVSAIAATPLRANRILAGTTSGSIIRNDDAVSGHESTAWPSAHPRDGWVSSLTFDPANADVAYATYAGFGGGAHVWRTADGGASWSAIGGDLPDIPAHTLAVYGNRLFLGTDLGVFVSLDGGAHWSVESNFPPVITKTLQVARRGNADALFAFTHGRGAWRGDLNPPQRRRAAGR